MIFNIIKNIISTAVFRKEISNYNNLFLDILSSSHFN